MPNVPIPEVDDSEKECYWLSDGPHFTLHELLPDDVWLAVVRDAVESYGHKTVYDHEGCKACDAALHARWDAVPEVAVTMPFYCSDHTGAVAARIPVDGVSPEGISYAGHCGNGTDPDESGSVYVIAYRYNAHTGYGAIVGVKPDQDAPFGWDVSCYAN